jgi:hypothetical protein
VRTPKTVLGLLKKAQRLLLEKGWTQRAFARTSTGEPIGRYNRESKPVSFCALGAVEHLSNNDYVRRDATYLLKDQIHYGSLIEWNDKRGRTKQQVIKLFDKAIEKAKR